MNNCANCGEGNATIVNNDTYFCSENCLAEFRALAKKIAEKL